jgi:hypothetical protein
MFLLYICLDFSVYLSTNNGILTKFPILNVFCVSEIKVFDVIKRIILNGIGHRTKTEGKNLCKNLSFDNFFYLLIFLLGSEEVWTKNMFTFLSTCSLITVGKK